MEKTKKIIKFIYCIVLWILMLIYILYRKDELLSNNIIPLDNIVLGLFAIFTLLPIFTEIDIVGIKLKKEIEKNKIETQKELLEIRSEINNSFLQNSSVIYNYMNMPDKALKDMEIEYNSKQKNDKDIDVDEESVLCFKIRQKVEIILKQIAQKNNIYLMRCSIIQLLKLLNSKEIISDKLYNVLIEILIICNKSIHGESISDNHSEFVKNTYAQVLQELEKINK